MLSGSWVIYQISKTKKLMAKKTVKFKQKKNVVINGERVETWPSTKQVRPGIENETVVYITEFDGPKNINEPIGLFSSEIPALLLRIALEMAIIPSS